MSRARLTWLLASVWSIPALLMTLQTYVYHEAGDHVGALLRAFLYEGVPWIVWIPMTPVVLRRADMGALRGRRLALHIALAFAIAVVFGAINGAFYHVLEFGSPATLASDLRMGMLDWVPLQPLVYAGVLAAGIAIDGARRRRAAELGRAQ